MGNEHCPTALDPFLPQNIPHHDVRSVVVLGKAIPHEKRLKSLERKGMTIIQALS